LRASEDAPFGTVGVFILYDLRREPSNCLLRILMRLTSGNGIITKIGEKLILPSDRVRDGYIIRCAGTSGWLGGRRSLAIESWHPRRRFRDLSGALGYCRLSSEPSGQILVG
jgi:hypothetical protein